MKTITTTLTVTYTVPEPGDELTYGAEIIGVLQDGHDITTTEHNDMGEARWIIAEGEQETNEEALFLADSWDIVLSRIYY